MREDGEELVSAADRVASFFFRLFSLGDIPQGAQERRIPLPTRRDDAHLRDARHDAALLSKSISAVLPEATGILKVSPATRRSNDPAWIRRRRSRSRSSPAGRRASTPSALFSTIASNAVSQTSSARFTLSLRFPPPIFQRRSLISWSEICKSLRLRLGCVVLAVTIPYPTRKTRACAAEPADP